MADRHPRFVAFAAAMLASTMAMTPFEHRHETPKPRLQNTKPTGKRATVKAARRQRRKANG